MALIKSDAIMMINNWPAMREEEKRSFVLRRFFHRPSRQSGIEPLTLLLLLLFPLTSTDV